MVKALHVLVVDAHVFVTQIVRNVEYIVRLRHLECQLALLNFMYGGFVVVLISQVQQELVPN